MTTGDDYYEKAIVTHLRDMVQQLGKLRAEVAEDTAQLLRNYREDNHRAIMGIYTRLVSIEDTIETERGARVTRQKLLDSQLEAIEQNQRFWVRVGMVAGILALGVAIGWLVL